MMSKLSTFRWFGLRAAIALGCTLSLLLLLGLSGHDAESREAATRAPDAKSVAKLLAAGEFDRALEAARKALTYDADDPTMLDLASLAAEQGGKKDEALWLAHLAARSALSTGQSGPVQRKLMARTQTLDPLPAAERVPLESYSRAVFDLAQRCAKGKLYANAVDFFQRCADTPLTQAATAQLKKLYANKRAVEALLASGIDVPLRATRRGSSRKKAKQDKAHSTWKKAWKIKGPNYTVKTNTSWKLGNAVLNAMEQVNLFYRIAFQHKLRGGGTARCTIRLYATRKEFELHEGEDSGTTIGFFSSDNYVACYDPRSTGERLGELWETLFHEASHQFTHMISTGRIPGWLDEGMATYFEGTRRQANGRVESNLVHEGRLAHLKDVLQAGKPSLKQVVSWFTDESYPVDYYPVGGYLVYFFKNYEDDQCERPYAKLFDAYVRSYRSGGKHDPYKRFVEFFVKKPRQPGIETFAQFQEHFKTWALRLHELQFGPPERASDLIDRAEHQRTCGKEDAAIHSYRWALDKSLNNPRALLGLAELHGQRKEHDAAVYCHRQLIDLARRAEDPAAPLDGAAGPSATALIERCSQAIQQVDAVLAKGVEEADKQFVEQARAAATKYAEAGYPRVAVWLLDSAIGAVAGHPGLEHAQHALESEHKVTARLWRRLSYDVEDWMPKGDWKMDGEALKGKSDPRGPQECLLRAELPDRFRFEVTVKNLKATGQDHFLGLLFGVDESAVWNVLTVDASGAADVSRAVAEFKVLQTLPSVEDVQDKPFTLGIEVERGRVRFFLDGEHVYTRAYPPSELRGRVGLILQDMEATFTNLRVSY